MAIPALEARLLSSQASPARVAAVLRRTLPDRGGEQHLLQPAGELSLRALEGEHGRGFSLRVEDEPLPHPPQAAAGPDRAGAPIHRAGPRTRFYARPRSAAAAASIQGQPETAGGNAGPFRP